MKSLFFVALTTIGTTLNAQAQIIPSTIQTPGDLAVLDRAVTLNPQYYMAQHPDTSNNYRLVVGRDTIPTSTPMPAEMIIRAQNGELGIKAEKTEIGIGSSDLYYFNQIAILGLNGQGMADRDSLYFGTIKLMQAKMTGKDIGKTLVLENATFTKPANGAATLIKGQPAWYGHRATTHKDTGKVNAQYFYTHGRIVQRSFNYSINRP